VLIDDLVTKGTKEPYRMFTSRAEYRLLLREDNADIRLSKYAAKYGLLEPSFTDAIKQKKETIDSAMEYLTTNYATPSKEFLAKLESLQIPKISDKTLLADVIGRGEFDKDKLIALLPEFEKYSDDVIEQILIESKYSRYIQKQQRQIMQMDEMLKIKIPSDFDYTTISGLSNEVVEKLQTTNPPTLFAASQISGVTPASLEIVHVYIKMRQRNAQG